MNDVIFLIGLLMKAICHPRYFAAPDNMREMQQLRRWDGGRGGKCCNLLNIVNGGFQMFEKMINIKIYLNMEAKITGDFVAYIEVKNQCVLAP